MGLPRLTRSLDRYGNNPGVKQQTAEFWTLGLHGTEVVPRFSILLTYFNTNYRHLIADLSASHQAHAE